MVVFNTLIAFMLMEMNVFQALGDVLGFYSNIAIAWMMAVVADLVINKPLGLSPKGIEFKRAYLYDINPVGAGGHGIGLGAVGGGAPGPVRAVGAGLLGRDCHGHSPGDGPAAGLGDPRALLHRAERRRPRRRKAPMFRSA